ncbi:hypothetical protein AS034_01675 [[Bacillus] enclensis]|uniref:DUF4367 domain-containing protein n=1 Tax=[Bacillus] enclensis TaxID=1402860 RepID=A0A0V8HQ16_9BACI|nr:hypothetical protein [[Bacillus] enclensis]KSU64570.1 hypothetical protein AS034_01675 [[Bacillus] enclensis]SCB76355.1 hypothetical protein GA0061094_0348 [[Bacillus] enclensis]
MSNKRIYDAIHNHIGKGEVFSKEEEYELLTKIENHHVPPAKRKWFPELVGLSLAGAAVLVMIGLIGSQTGLFSFLGGGQPDKLDTSLLKESEIHGLEDMSEERREEFLTRQPKAYYAESVDDALNALPFKLNLPEKLPFDSAFVVEGINDWHYPSNTDGKDISATFRAAKGNEFILIEAIDFEQEFVESGNQSETSVEEVELKKGIQGNLEMMSSGGKIQFENKKGIKIKIYLHDSENIYNAREVLMDLANQMVD